VAPLGSLIVILIIKLNLAVAALLLMPLVASCHLLHEILILEAKSLNLKKVVLQTSYGIYAVIIVILIPLIFFFETLIISLQDVY